MGEKRLVIGLTGKIGSGKGTVADILKEKGFFATSISDSIREEIRNRGLEVTRENLLIISDEMRQKFGPEVWVTRTWQKVVEQGSANAVVDSIRGEVEVEFLQKQEGFFLIGVEAPLEIRFKRIQERGRESDPKTLEEFIATESRDVKSGSGNIGRNVEACLAKADFTIVNDGNLEELKAKIEEILKKI